MDQQNIPPATYDVQQDLMRKKKDLEQAFKDFHELVSNKVLDKNKSPAVKKTEQNVVTMLIKAAAALEQVNVGEGILSLAAIAIREQLIVRDRVNELEYELCLMKRDLEKLKKSDNQDGKK